VAAGRPRRPRRRGRRPAGRVGPLGCGARRPPAAPHVAAGSGHHDRLQHGRWGSAGEQQGCADRGGRPLPDGRAAQVEPAAGGADRRVEPQVSVVGDDGDRRAPARSLAQCGRPDKGEDQPSGRRAAAGPAGVGCGRGVHPQLPVLGQDRHGRAVVGVGARRRRQDRADPLPGRHAVINPRRVGELRARPQVPVSAEHVHPPADDVLPVHREHADAAGRGGGSGAAVRGPLRVERRPLRRRPEASVPSSTYMRKRKSVGIAA
jgi:hypothetical protein